VRLDHDAATEAFRAELDAWLDAHVPTGAEMDERVLSSAHLPAWARRWQRTLFDAGWLVPGWPPEYGGRNATPVQQLVYFEELARRDVPRGFNPQGLSIIAPSILDVGTEEQKQRYALPTLRAEISWCLGMSEPGAGSDLAGLQTRAVLDGDDFIVSGQKVWTSGAQHADVCFCFVRTDPDAPKHRGISVLVVDMRSPGITVRPLAELTDPNRADFNEVFFDEVRVPHRDLIGELNRGWSVAGGSLAHERGMVWLANVHTVQQQLDDLIVAARETTLRDDPVFRDELATLAVDVHALHLLGYRGFAKFARGTDAVEHTIMKLFSSEVRRRIGRAGVDWLGADALDVDTRGVSPSMETGPWPFRWLHAFGHTIAGGTSEIQRNIVAERVLGLPRG
jgi:alkylation response protein AidB-like acyl-CoA dehydrogenase